MAVVRPEVRAFHDAGVLSRHALLGLQGLSRPPAVDARGVQQAGVTPIAISADNAERACSAEARWGLQDLCVAYGLSLRQAREWGLYVSRGCGRSSLGIEEPPMFVEPALFLVRPDRTLYYASVQSMPFGRPCFEEMLSGIEKAVARDYPARGEVAD